MKQEYKNKLASYQEDNYVQLLRDKKVFDARQFLISSLLYMNYAFMTATLYESAGRIDSSQDNLLFSNDNVEIMGRSYNVRRILNKFTFEWIVHMADSLDCLCQYVNAALNLGIMVKKVRYEEVEKKTINYISLQNALIALYQNITVDYIRSFYNYGKHTISLYGEISPLDIFYGKHDILLPKFVFKENPKPQKQTSELIADFETIVGLYIDVLDAVDAVLRSNAPVNNRLHVSEIVVGELHTGTNNAGDITLYADFDVAGRVSRFWIEDVVFNKNNSLELLILSEKDIAQHPGKINTIEVYENGNIIGELNADNPIVSNSTLQYHSYSFSPI